jgi:hypothetical protein
MANLKFSTEGQQEALAAQEAIAKKARELKQEFESGMKATDTWDTSISKMQRTSESALRSVQTEQEKIVKQIDAIKDAVANGLYDGREEEAAEAIERLQKKWVAVDEATLNAKAQTKEYELAQQQLKSAAESALGSVQTELEKVKADIETVEQESRDGLIDPEEAEAGLERLRDKLAALEDESKTVGDKINAALGKAFSIERVLKFGVKFVGVAAAVSLLKKTIAEAQETVDRAATFAMSEEEAEFGLGRALAGRGTGTNRSRRVFDRAGGIAASSGVARKDILAALASLIGEGTDIDTALFAVQRHAPLYPDKPGEIAGAARDWISNTNSPIPTRADIEARIPGGAPRIGRREAGERAEDRVKRRRAELDEAAGLASQEERDRVDRARQALGIDPVLGFTSTVGTRMPWSDGGTGVTREELADMLRTFVDINQGQGAYAHGSQVEQRETDPQLLQAVKEMAGELRGLRSDVKEEGGIQVGGA